MRIVVVKMPKFLGSIFRKVLRMDRWSKKSNGICIYITNPVVA